MTEITCAGYGGYQRPGHISMTNDLVVVFVTQSGVNHRCDRFCAVKITKRVHVQCLVQFSAAPGAGVKLYGRESVDICREVLELEYRA